MKVIHINNSLSSTWYTKSTDTGLLMNYHALAPMKYKKSVIIGMIHRIFRACSTYKHFHESLQKARDILLKNQYPESVIDRLIKDTLNKIFEKKETVTESEEVFCCKIQKNHCSPPRTRLLVGKTNQILTQNLYGLRRWC